MEEELTSSMPKEEGEKGSRDCRAWNRVKMTYVVKGGPAICVVESEFLFEALSSWI